jgi:hypothetical protein
MKLKALINVLTDTQMINICVRDSDDFEIAGRLRSIPEKLLVPLWSDGVAEIFTDDEETLIVVLKGDDGDDESAES